MTPTGPASPPLVRRLGIVGLGLIGGSLALAAKATQAVGKIVGIDRDAAHREAALRLGIADDVAADLHALGGADVVVLAVPVCAIPTLLPAVARAAPATCVITDVGSVKAPILAAGEAACPEGRFVPGHPIAGREHSGPGAARADLFQGAVCILTPGGRARRAAVAGVEALWLAAGARVVRMEAAWHDEVLAAVSHLPHLVAYGLMDGVLRMERGAQRPRFSAGGLRDFTRVASSDPEMWRDIFLMNREPLLRTLASYREALDGLETAMRAADGEALMRVLGQARLAREELSSPTTR